MSEQVGRIPRADDIGAAANQPRGIRRSTCGTLKTDVPCA
jgi:hypothetical protein